MPLKASITQGPSQIDSTQNQFHVFGQIATSGSYVVNGDTLDLSQMSNYGGGLPSRAAPLSVRIWEQGAPNSGWRYDFVPGTTQANGVMQVFGSNGAAPAALAQPGAVTYARIGIPATLYYEAWFPSFNDNA